jgi:hypothetical protein
MKKIYKPLLFLLIAAVIVGGMYWKSKIDDPGPEAGPVDSTPTASTFKEIQAKCESMGKKAWNPNEYKFIKRTVETSSTGTSTISSDEAAILKTTLEQKYAESMVISYKEWIKNLGATNIQEVASAMNTQISINGCRAILEIPMLVIKKHGIALTIPSMVEGFKHQKFDKKRYDELMNLVTDCCNQTPDIVSFPEIIDIFNNYTKELNDFKEYGTEFNEKLDYIRRHEDEKVEQLSNFCTNTNNPNKKTFQYLWYSNKLTELGICN